MKSKILANYVSLLVSALFLTLVSVDIKAQPIDSLQWNKARKSAYRSLNGVGTELNYKKAYVIFKRLGMSGDAESINALGMMYKHGLGVKQNDEKAVSLFRKSSEMGYSKATYNLALAYKYGAGVDQDPEQAFKLFEETKKSDSKIANYSIAYSHYKGLGTKQDYKKAVEYFELGAKEGNPACMFNLGLCYFRGRGIERNSELGKQWVEQAALKGFSRAIDFIAREDSKNFGKPRAKNKSLNSSALESLIPATHQIVKMPHRTTMLKSSSSTTHSDITGQWVGKIITYDWSGAEIEEEIDLEVVIDNDGYKLNGLWIENDDYPVHINAQLGDSSWIFSNTVLRESARPLKIKNGTLKIEQKAGQEYLVGNIYLYSDITKEYTAPNYILLGRKQDGIKDDLSVENQAETGSDVLVFPNPFGDNINIRFAFDEEQQVSIEIFNMAGVKVYAEKTKVYSMGVHTKSIPTSSFVPGAYILNVSGSINKSLILTK